MTDIQMLNETTLARESLRRLSDENSILHRVAYIFALVGRNSVGLGEVLQDYARQSYHQLQDIIRVSALLAHGAPVQPADVEVLGNIHTALKTVKSVLEMTPAAMLRNKAETIGEKEKISRADIAQAADAFLHTPDIARLLASEDSGVVLATLMSGSEVDAALLGSASDHMATLHH